MRTLFRATLEVTAANEAIRNGTLPKIIKATSDRIKPEAAYFLTNEGERSCIMVFDMKDPSEIPAIAEPFFMHLNARVEFSPVMNANDLEKGLKSYMKMAEPEMA